MLTRREFNLSSLKAALVAPLLRAFRSSSSSPLRSTDSQNGFPAGDYTPYGYLDNPYHCWALNRSGILRSCRGIGFGWHYPAGPGGYFDEKKNGIYSAFLRLGFQLGNGRVWEMDDLREGELRCVYHSSKLITHGINISGARLLCTFVQVDENALSARVERTDAEPAVPVLVIAAHRHQLGNAEWWGGDGVVGESRFDRDVLLTRSFAAGTVFALGSAEKPATQFFFSGESPFPALLEANQRAVNAIAYAHKAVSGAMVFELVPGRTLDICMARGVNESGAVRELRRAFSQRTEVVQQKRDSDTGFWRKAPRPEGDWPQHWKNGWVYDFETLRMMVRRPIGAYKHPWDAMQIQAPRNVLAETSIDMWALSHADPDTAKEVFLGQFLDALEPNIPCMREDGVMNMVAADGSECGTSISWCYPFFCAASIYARTGDLNWLGRLYPGLAKLLRWTVANRSDKEGFLIGKCSWETGMDSARRFLIEQPTGAELIEFIRIVELQAAAAQAAGVLERFAHELGQTNDVMEWSRLRELYRAKTQQLWNGKDWFHDFDTRENHSIVDVGKDIGQVAPIFCGLTSAEQTRAMVPALREFYEHSSSGSLKNEDGWVDGLQWSSLTLPYLESLWTAGEYELLSQVVHMIAERIYPTMDRRRVTGSDGDWTIPREGDPRIGIPGVSCEMWTAQGAAGGEGYGWGAVLPAHIMRNIVGIRELENGSGLWLCPNLPAQFMAPGRTYVLRNWRYRELTLTVRYAVQPGERLNVELAVVPPTRRLAVFTPDGRKIENTTVAAGSFRFLSPNRTPYKIKIGNA